MPKGGARIEGHVLFGKYRLCRKLGAGRSGTVFLAYHLELEEYRAVKIVPKTMADYETFKKEALFLKTLRHPGIPLVYDVEEDLTNSYLIEEYLEGESLYALVKRLGSLSMKTAAEIGIQVCRLIQFMNTADNPILYLDLQPKNLLVCNGTVRLIDFDHAQYAEDAAVFGERYGTIGFAAPEQYLGEALDCRTDVYAIGALLFFMYRGEVPVKECEKQTNGNNRELDRIIRGCMAEKKEERYPNAGELEQALCELKADISKEQAIESLTIVVAGASRGIGTTHAALGITGFLTRNGYPALYQEAHDSDAARTLAKNMKGKADDAGILRVGGLSVLPCYGEAVKLPSRYFPAVVKDVGTVWPGSAEGADIGISRPGPGVMPDAGFYVLVCGGKWWEIDRTVRAARYLLLRGRVVLLFNHMTEEIRVRLPEDLAGAPWIRLPFFANPLKENAAAAACFRKVMEAGTGGTDLWNEGRKKKWFWSRRRG